MGSNPQKGIDFTVLQGNGSQLLWGPSSLWWQNNDLVHATTKYIPADIDGDGRLDLLYASERNGGGFDMALQVNDGSGLAYVDHMWYSPDNLKTTRFIPGFWANQTRQGFAYAKKHTNGDGFDFAVMDMTSTGMVWRGNWYPEPNKKLSETVFIPADFNGDGYTDLFYAMPKPNGVGFDMPLQMSTGSGLMWVGHQWNPDSHYLKDIRFLPGF